MAFKICSKFSAVRSIHRWSSPFVRKLRLRYCRDDRKVRSRDYLHLQDLRILLNFSFTDDVSSQFFVFLVFGDVLKICL